MTNINKSIEKINTILSSNEIFDKSNYNEFIEFLNKEHGKPKHDYFNFTSYENHVKNSFCYLTKKYLGITNKLNKPNKPNKPDRTKEIKKDLELHHINENKFKNLGSAKKIYMEKIFGNEAFCAFSNQKKENLVLCNILEHTFLHALILIEFGVGSIDESNGYNSLKGRLKKDIKNKNYEHKILEIIDKLDKLLENSVLTKKGD